MFYDINFGICDVVGISLGLILFGPCLIKMVGEQITKMNPMRAFCVASGLGLPVSSTHIAVGAIFGVGFYREYYSEKNKRMCRKAHEKKLYGDDLGAEVGIYPYFKLQNPDDWSGVHTS